MADAPPSTQHKVFFTGCGGEVIAGARHWVSLAEAEILIELYDDETAAALAAGQNEVADSARILRRQLEHAIAACRLWRRAGGGLERTCWDR